VKLALGEERKLTGLSASYINGVSSKEYSYRADTQQNLDMAAYLAFLREQDGFLALRDWDFSGPTGQASLARNAVDAGYVVVVEIEYGVTGYTVTLTRQKGGFTPDE